MWTTTAAGLALFARRSPPLATALAAAAAGLVFDLAGRLPGHGGYGWPRQPGRVDGPTHQPADPFACIPPPPWAAAPDTTAARQHQSSTANERQFDDRG